MVNKIFIKTPNTLGLQSCLGKLLCGEFLKHKIFWGANLN